MNDRINGIIAGSVTSRAPGRVTGRVKWFNEKKGYGFIVASGDNPDAKQQNYFFYYRDILMTGFRTVKTDQDVEFIPQVSAKGRIAREIVPLDDD